MYHSDGTKELICNTPIEAIIMSELPTINRCVLMVMPKEPYFDWANSLQGALPMVEPDDTMQPSSYLLPDFEDEEDVEKFIKKNFRIIFDNELSAWTSNVSEWPTKITYKVFKDWFDIHFSTMVFDLGEGAIEVV
jgi:hypothetical protein